MNKKTNMRRTKIVATMGPATDTPESVYELIEAGVDVVRLNFSHGNPEDHKLRAEMVRSAAEKLDRSVAIMGDLQGPKIRIDKFIDKKIELALGDKFILDADLDASAGTEERVGVTYKNLVNDVSSGDELLLDDGRIILEVEKVAGNEIHTVTTNGGTLSDNKGINRRFGGLSAEALSNKDKADIKTAADINVDFLAISFPRTADDIETARSLLQEAGSNAGIVAKMERAEAIEQPTLDKIIDASDVIMVARGDLGVEIGDSNLPRAQKKLISRARKKNCAVITATQMMETMIENQIPTRAEVFDVANAVMDGTDAVMLSGETAVGKHPTKVIEAMNRICREAENVAWQSKSKHRVGGKFKHTDEGIAMGTMYLANHMKIKAIGALTESGTTALWMSRIRSDIPIYALTTLKETCRRVCMYRGVYPVWVDADFIDTQKANKLVVDHLLSHEVVVEDDLVIVTKGDKRIHGGTNQLKIIKVGEH